MTQLVYEVNQVLSFVSQAILYVHQDYKKDGHWSVLCNMRVDVALLLSILLYTSGVCDHVPASIFPAAPDSV